MEPQLYVELDTDLQTEKFREWVGREFARDYGLEYPMPPDSYNGSTTPPFPAWTYTWFYWTSDAAADKAKQGGGTVFVLDDDVVRFATQEQTLSDGVAYSYDIATNAKTAEQLSELGQAAIAPVGP
jgi:hypothetical protein